MNYEAASTSQKGGGSVESKRSDIQDIKEDLFENLLLICVAKEVKHTFIHFT